MNKITNYQNTINKFIKSKDIFEYVNNIHYDELIVLFEQNYISSIFILTFCTMLNKKTKTHQHGFYLSLTTELLLLLSRVLDGRHDIDIRMTPKITHIANIIFTYNLNLLANKEKTLKAYNNSIREINLLCIKLYDKSKIQNRKYQSNDFIHYKNTNNDELNKIKQNNQMTKDELIQHAHDKYSSILELMLGIIWSINSENENMKKHISKVGTHVGVMIKIIDDIKYIKKDIHQKQNTNFVLNIGIQETFELFIEAKQKFLEQCMKLDLYTNIVKEIADYIESFIDKLIENTNASYP